MSFLESLNLARERIASAEAVFFFFLGGIFFTEGV